MKYLLVIILTFSFLPAFSKCSTFSRTYTGFFSQVGGNFNFSRTPYRFVYKNGSFKVTDTDTGNSFFQTVNNNCGSLVFQLPFVVQSNEQGVLSSPLNCVGSLFKNKIQANCQGTTTVITQFGVDTPTISGQLFLMSR